MTAVRVVRVVVMAVRPPVAAVLLLFAALGQAMAGSPEALDPLLTTTLAIVACWLVNATALNDLGDEAIDRINLAGALGRPLVSGDATRDQLAALAAAAGVAALVLSAVLAGPATTAVVAVGLALNTAYSVRPLRLCDRGLVALALLPAGYVAVPFLVGALAVGPFGWSVVAPLPGLYVAFVGRIALKDFRDTVGDAAHGKRTFLLRYGAHATCLTAGVAWVVGTTAVAATLPLRPTFVVGLAAATACALHALGVLSQQRDLIAQQAVIGAVAQAGRASGIVTLAHLTLLAQGRSATVHDLVLLAIAAGFTYAHAEALAEPERRPALLRPW